MSDMRMKELFILIVVLSLVLSIKLINIFKYKYLEGDLLNYAKYSTTNEETDNNKINPNLNSKSQTQYSNKLQILEGSPQMIMIHVKGAVKSSGVYEIAKKSRVCDAIDIAGGFAEDAQIEALNLADYLYDAQQIVVPRIGEKIDNVNLETNKKWTISDLNQASIEDLKSICGIGPTTAQKIVNYRNTHGAFSKLSDLQNVNGIGQKTIEGWKEFFVEP